MLLIKVINMNQKYIKIAKHFFQIVINEDNLVNYFNKHFYLIENKNVQQDMLITIAVGYGRPFKDYEVDITKESNKLYFRRADYLIEVDADYKTAKVSVHDELALKHALMNLYSSFIVYHNWGLLIHSSCVMESGKAHVFAGQSGAGKSTAAKLSYPRDLLSDEATILKITSGGITVFNSPFRSELESTNFVASSPLASIQLIIQSLQNNRSLLKKSDALIALMDKVFYWHHNSDETRRIIRLLKLLVDQVPVYNLHFKKNNTFWELIS
jgi:hypothetical protein